ncbi:MAG TPA: hypothetical protein VKA48_10080, partial [Gammaproteobacteria bacterium]|nr:hypothetical protein [Gammaproteobacteria bacterium]
EPALVHWSADEWAHRADARTEPAGLGMHAVDLSTADVPEGGAIVMTFRWEDRGRWEGRDFRVSIGS